MRKRKKKTTRISLAACRSILTVNRCITLLIYVRSLLSKIVSLVDEQMFRVRFAQIFSRKSICLFSFDGSNCYSFLTSISFIDHDKQKKRLMEREHHHHHHHCLNATDIRMDKQMHWICVLMLTKKIYVLLDQNEKRDIEIFSRNAPVHKRTKAFFDEGRQAWLVWSCLN